jgi:hypothetical protein
MLQVIGAGFVEQEHIVWDMRLRNLASVPAIVFPKYQRIQVIRTSGTLPLMASPLIGMRFSLRIVPQSSGLRLPSCPK